MGRGSKISQNNWGGIPIGKLNQMGEKEKMKRNLALVLLNKVGDHCEGENSNTTIPVSYQGIKTFTILESGAGVSIATKGIWES